MHRDKHTSRVIFEFIMALTMNGQLLIWDAMTTILISSVDLLKAGEIAKDFMFLNDIPDREGKINENSKLVLLLMNREGTCQVSYNLLDK